MDAPFQIRPLRLSDGQSTHTGAYGAHRHDFQEIIIITEGGAFHRIDWEDHHLAGPHAVLVAQGKIHLFMTEPGTRGWVLAFAPEVLPQTASWLFSHFFALSNVPLDDPPCLARIESLCLMLEELHAEDGGRGQAEAYLLAALLSMLDARVQASTLRGRPERSSEFRIVKDFLGILDAHYRAEKDLGFYANRLRVNPRRLTHVCRQIMGRTPAGLLEERCMVEAKRFLVHSNLTIQQIASALGYEDQSYFTKVFRKVVKETPSRFRETWSAPVP